jgi:hypothetical protein
MKETKTFVIIAVCLGAFSLALLSRFYLSGGFQSIGGLGGVATTALGVVREKFMQQEIGAPVNSDGMEGVYSGIDISNGGSWSESKAPVSPKGFEAQDDFPLFAFQDISKFKAECCTTSSSSISNDMGCLCMTKEEERELGTRGGNRKAN